MVKIYCDLCGDFTNIGKIKISKDSLNKNPWSDILCKKCKLVLCTVRVKEEGVYKFVKVDEINKKTEERMRKI